MERSTAVEENHQSRDSNLVSKSVGSLIKIDSISIDLVNANDKIDAGKCEHFSIRGYVSEIRNKDWKIGWPFALDGNHDKSEEETCLLPPLTIPRFKWWCCQNCQREIGAEDTANTHGPVLKCCSARFKSNGTCSHGSSLGDATMLLTSFQHALNLNILEGGNVDANPSTNVNGNDYCRSLSEDKKEKKVEAANTTIKGLEIGSEVNRNQDIPVSTCAATKVISSLMQERCHADDIAEALKTNCSGSVEFCNPGCGSHEVADIEPVDTKNSSEICQTGKQISANDQHAELMIACRTSAVAGIDEALNPVKNHSSKHPSSELDEYDYASSESAEILVRNNLQDHHPDKSGGLPRRKIRKVRLLTELLGRNGEANTDLLRTEDSLSNAIPDASAEVGMLSASQGQVAVQGNLTSGLGQNRKRKLPQDEEWNPPEMSSPTNTAKKVLRTFNGGAGTSTDAIASSGPEEQAFTGLALQIGLKTDSRIERSPIIGKKKNKTTKVVHESLSLARFQENVPKEIHEKIGDASKGDAADSVFFKSVHAGFTGRGKDPFTFPALKMEGKSISCKKKSKMPRVDDEQASLISWNNGMLREGPSTRKDVDNMQTGSITVPFQSSQDAFTEQGLHLSLNSYMSAQRYDRKSIPQLTEGRASVLPWQKDTPKEDQIKRKDVRINYVRDSSIPSKSEPDAYFRKKTNHKMPFLNEKQKHASQVEGGGCSLTQQMDFCGTSNKGKAIEIQEHSAVTRKIGDQRTNKVSEVGALDDIPMEIVELMAKNQYERCLPDADNDKQPLETANNTRDAQIMDLNKAYGNGELSLLQEETAHRRKPRAKNGGNGKITRSENVGTTKHKTVDYFSHIDKNHFNKSRLDQTYAPPGFGPFPQCQEKPSSGVQYSATSSSRHTSGQNSQWMGKMVGHTSSHASMPAFRACDTCQGAPRQSEAATHLWSPMITSHMPFVYNTAQKCADQSTSTNNDVLSHCSGSLPKGNMNGDHNLNFSNPKASNLEKQNGNFDSETLSRTRAEYPFASKHNGMGSLDLYSNETIPAMHLLSLMDAGLRSGAPIDMNGTPKFLKRPSFPHHHHSKEFPGLPLGGYKTDTMKHPTYDYYGKNHLSENSRECFPTIPTVGASAFSFQHDKSLKRATDFTDQVSLQSREKEKTKVSNSPTQNRGRSSQNSVLTSGGLGTNRGSVPGHSIQKMSLHTLDSMLPFPFHAVENATKYKLEAPSTNGTVQHRKGILETDICTINRNPADFSMPEAGNEYMIAGEDLKFRKRIPSENRSGLIKLDGHKRQRKVTVVKEPARNRIS